MILDDEYDKYKLDINKNKIVVYTVITGEYDDN
jgi:hypothetical protein